LRFGKTEALNFRPMADEAIEVDPVFDN